MNIEKANNYVYKVSDNMHYIGCRSTDLEPLDDLGIKYFTSSTDKEFRKLFTTRPDLFDLDILGNFATRKEAMQMEIDQHMIYDVGNNPKFWNKAKATSTGFDMSGTVAANKGRVMSEEQKVKLREAQKGRVFTAEHRAKMCEVKKGKKHPMFGKHHSVETKEKMSKAQKGKVLSEETKAKLREACKGRKPTSEHRANNSKAQKNRPRKTCEHCGATMDVSNFTRWHGDKCRNKL